MLIRLGHSPDPDDAFMFWAIAAGAIDTRGFRFEQVLQDIQTLNEWALDGRLEVTATSLHAYPFVQDRYALLPHGASIGAGYGPILVAREPLGFEQLRFAEIVVPGRMTTAFLTLRLALGGFAHRELPFDRILDEVSSGRADAGLVIHEGQLTYEAQGLHKVLDLGEWWLLETGQPLPWASTSRGATSATACPISRPCCSTRSGPGSRTGARPCATPCASAVASMPPRTSASSTCTSTSSRATTATRGAGRSR